MKRFNLLFALFLAFAPTLAWGQSALPYSSSPNWYVTGSGTSANDTPIAITDVSRFRVVSVQLLGTWTGTVTWEVSNDGVTWTSVLMALSTATTGATTATANGTYIGSMNALYFRARFSTASSGTVNAKAVFFTTSASAGGAGGVGPGAVSSVTGTTNQIDCTPTTGDVVCGLSATIVTPGSVAMGANVLSFTDSTFIRDATNSIAGNNTIDLRNGTNPQQLNIFGTYTDATTNEYLRLVWTSSLAIIETAKGTVGGVARQLIFRGSGGAFQAMTVGTALNGGIVLGTTATTTALTLGRVDVGNNLGNTSTTGTSIDLRVRENYAPTATSTMVALPLSIEPTINYSNGTPGAGSYEAIHIAVTETALPTGTSYVIRALGGAAASTAIWSVTNGGNEALAGTLTSSRTTDLGWSIVNAANQACNTTCTSACVFGFDTGALGNLKLCTDATADSCLCAGAS